MGAIGMMGGIGMVGTIGMVETIGMMGIIRDGGGHEELYGGHEGLWRALGWWGLQG